MTELSELLEGAGVIERYFPARKTNSEEPVTVSDSRSLSWLKIQPKETVIPGAGECALDDKTAS